MEETVTHAVKIEDPSLFVKLKWTDATVDMNLILWRSNPAGSQFYFEKASELNNNNNEEYLTIPGSSTDAVYGLTYHYFSGSASNLNFTVTFSTTAGSIEGNKKQKTFTGTYTSANKNPSYIVDVEQLLVKSGHYYNTFSEIIIPDEGSRIKNAIPFVTGSEYSR